MLAAGVTYATEIVFFGENSDKGNISASSINSGLVGHWALDSESYNSVTGRVTDKSAYENHGTNYEATLTTDRMGHINGAMSFDGNDYIDASLDLSWDETKNISISFWVNPMSDTISLNGVVGKGGWEWSIYQNSKSLNLVYWDNTGDHANGMDNGWGDVLNAGNWTHITYTWNSTASLFYANGVLVNTHVATNPSLNQDRASNIAIGGNIYTWRVKYWNGSIANVRVYNRTLSPTEISVLYNSYNPKLSSGSLQKGLVLDMPLTSSATKSSTPGSEIMTDKTPYSNDGQNYGATVGSDSTSFDGGSDYILIGNHEELNSPKITVSSWFKINLTGNIYNYITSNAKDCCGSYNGTEFWVYSGYLYGTIWNGTSASVSSLYILNPNQWYYGAFTYNGSVINLYLDGILIATTFSTLGIGSTPSYPFAIGGMGMSPNEYNINGSISNVKIYNRALSDSEIKLLYDKGR